VAFADNNMSSSRNIALSSGCQRAICELLQLQII